MKRLAAVTLILLLICANALASFPCPQDEIRIDTDIRPAYVQQLMQIAEGELGYTEGPNNYSKYGEWSGDANAAWCAEFVCWCVNQTDEQFGTDLLNRVYPNYSGQNTGRDWFIRQGRFVYRKGNCPGWGYQWAKCADHYLTKNEYIPAAGDLLFFSYNEAGDTEHVALIEAVTRTGSGEIRLHVIEGNNPSAVQRNSYLLNNSQVLGFGICEDLADTTMRTGCTGEKVRALQSDLCRLGYLDEINVTGTFGGNTAQAVSDFQKDYCKDRTYFGIADRVTVQAVEEAMIRLEFDTAENWEVEE